MCLQASLCGPCAATLITFPAIPGLNLLCANYCSRVQVQGESRPRTSLAVRIELESVFSHELKTYQVGRLELVP